MKHGLGIVLTTALLLLLVLPTPAQRRHDPLNPQEVDELRDSRMEPEKRIKLLVKFTQTRFQTLDTLRNAQLNAKAIDELTQLLDDIASLVDEIDDNLQEYDQQHEELRKGLRAVIDAEADFQAKLKSLKESPAGQHREISFGIQNATESIDSSLSSAKAMFEDQNARKGKEPVEKATKGSREGKQ
jgi:hypothetical protein